MKRAEDLVKSAQLLINDIENLKKNADKEIRKIAEKSVKDGIKRILNEIR